MSLIVGGVIILCLLMIMFGKKTKNIVNLPPAKDDKVPEEEITKNKKVVVFDFDETLTMEHTGGCDDEKYLKDIEYIGTVENIQKLKQMLIQLRQKGFVVYVCTRGFAEGVKTYMNNMLGPNDCDKLIVKVLGSECSEDVNALITKEIYQKIEHQKQKGVTQQMEKLNEAFQKADTEVIAKIIKETKILKPRGVKTLTNEDERVWAFKKEKFLGEIVNEQGVTKNDVYFFDNSPINVIYALLCGFEKSYTIYDGVHDRCIQSPLWINPQNEDERCLHYTVRLVDHLLLQQ
jgi:hydroxymethylpyrimidine pyrophosphatase-like HAD family hydrolase